MSGPALTLTRPKLLVAQAGAQGHSVRRVWPFDFLPLRSHSRPMWRGRTSAAVGRRDLPGRRRVRDVLTTEQAPMSIDDFDGVLEAAAARVGRICAEAQPS